MSEKREYKLGITREFDAQGNLARQWIHVAADTLEELEDWYGDLTGGVLGWPVALGTEAPESPEPLPETRHAPSVPQRAQRGGADIFRRIMGMSHGLDTALVQEYFGQYEDAELWTGDLGTKAPGRDWLETLTQPQLNTIERDLRKMQDEAKARRRA